jgi:hypothetical protein
MSNVYQVMTGTAAVGWLAGIVLANGAISTAVAVWMPPYAWYLVLEKVMMMSC